MTVSEITNCCSALSPSSLRRAGQIMLLTGLLAAGLALCNPVQASYLYGNYTYPTGSSGGNGVSGSKSTYMAMTSPDHRNIRVIAFSIDYTAGPDPRYIRMGLYEGGIPNNPAGAQLKYDSGPVLIANTATIDHQIPITPPYDLGQNIQFGIALKTDANFRGVGLFSCQGWPCPTDASGGDSDFFWNNQDEPQDALFHFDPNQPFNPTILGTNLLTGHRVGAYSNEYTTFYYSMIYVLYPSIDNITPGFVNDGQTDVHLEGAGFEEEDEFGAGTSKIWLTENNNWAAPGTKVQQTDTTWSNTTISFTVSFGTLVAGTTAYLWVENSDGQVNAAGTPVQLNVPCPDPPAEIGNALSVAPDDGSLVSSSFTITDEFTDTETVHGCLYTVNGGTVWQPGVVSGTGPYTCTAANITSIDAAELLIRMKATSCGGTSAPDSLLSRTVDAQGPVATSITATPGDIQCTLAWSGTDSGTGMHATEPFEIRWATWPLANCSSGNSLYIGTDTNLVHSALENGRTYHYRLCLKDNFGNPTEASTTCTLNATPWTVLNDGLSPPGNGYTTGSVINRTVSAFTLELTNGAITDTDTVTQLVVTGTNTANISNVKIYRDNGTDANKYDPADTLVATASFSGNTATFSGLSIPVTTTTTQYLLTYDIVAAPQAGATLTAYVSAATAQTHSVDSNDNVDATLTIEMIAPTTTDSINSSSWSGGERTVVLSVSDGGGSGVDTATGVYGCFGTACTPAVLGGIFMTTNCGAGNTCQYPIRYYSIDRAGNIEAVKTDAYLAMVDRKAPEGGALSAFGGATPIGLNWPGISDTGGSGISWYKLLRTDGPTPPANCSSGTVIYQGTDISASDSGVWGSQQYSYRLCASDAAGNVNSDYVATASAGAPCTNVIVCEDCHGGVPGGGPPPMLGGSRILPPAGHSFHPGIGCWECHRNGGTPDHVDGIVTSNPLSGSWGGDYPWPTGGGMGCGGPLYPVGGTPDGGMMGCHATGTARYPLLTPEWTCMWDDVGTCLPPP